MVTIKRFLGTLLGVAAGFAGAGNATSTASNARMQSKIEQIQRIATRRNNEAGDISRSRTRSRNNYTRFAVAGDARGEKSGEEKIQEAIKKRATRGSILRRNAELSAYGKTPEGRSRARSLWGLRPFESTGSEFF